jgi:hypothetical protein
LAPELVEGVEGGGDCGFDELSHRVKKLPITTCRLWVTKNLAGFLVFESQNPLRKRRVFGFYTSSNLIS